MKQKQTSVLAPLKTAAGKSTAIGRLLLTILLVFTFLAAARAQKAIPNNNVLVNMEPSCPAPTDFAVAENGITNHTATLQWTGYSDSYTVSYRTAEGISPVISEGFENGIDGWTEKGDATAWQICLDNDENNLIDVTQYPYTLTDLTAETTYNVKVRADYGENKSELSSDVTFEPTVKTVIGSGTTTSSVVPIKTNCNYSLSQQIYTSAELGDAGLIESIDFFNESLPVERNLNIYMVSTDKDEFASNTDWISVTDDNLVFSGNVTFFAGVWTTIALDNCFVYDGNSNVVIVVDDNTGSSNNTAVNFRTFTASDKYQALSACSDNNDFDPIGSLGDVNESNKSKN